MTGGTLLKNRQLRCLGYRIVKIPYFEWYAARGKHEEYLREKLTTATRYAKDYQDRASMSREPRYDMSKVWVGAKPGDPDVTSTGSVGKASDAGEAQVPEGMDEVWNIYGGV